MKKKGQVIALNKMYTQWIWCPQKCGIPDTTSASQKASAWSEPSVWAFLTGMERVGCEPAGVENLSAQKTL